MGQLGLGAGHRAPPLVQLAVIDQRGVAGADDLDRGADVGGPGRAVHGDLHAVVIERRGQSDQIDLRAPGHRDPRNPRDPRGPRKHRDAINAGLDTMRHRIEASPDAVMAVKPSVALWSGL